MKGKTALVTGAGKKTGIGYAIAGRPAAYGCDIVIADLGRPPEVALCRPLWRGKGAEKIKNLVDFLT